MTDPTAHRDAFVTLARAALPNLCVIPPPDPAPLAAPGVGPGRGLLVRLAQ